MPRINALAERHNPTYNNVMKIKLYKPRLRLLLLGLLITTLPWGQSIAETSNNNAVVFMYHHFGVKQHPTTNVSLDQFDAHLDHLQQQGYSVWPLQDIVSHLKQGKVLPDRTVAITVDDAYISVYTEAWPRLRQRSWPLTVFVSSAGVDRKQPAYMSWEQMREMQQQGASFANHSSNHDYLIRRQSGEDRQAWLQRVRADIQHNQQRLQQELGNVPLLFAYPYGEYNLALKALLKELGYTAFTQQSGAINNHSDPQLLPRFPMAAHFADIDSFRTKAATLALPVISAKPEEPVTEQHQPSITITLNNEETSDIQLKQLSCFISGQGQTAVQWLDKIRFTLTAARPLPEGRNRYNCTAPSKQKSGRYYWFSRLWIVQGEY